MPLSIVQFIPFLPCAFSINYINNFDEHFGQRTHHRSSDRRKERQQKLGGKEGGVHPASNGFAFPSGPPRYTSISSHLDRSVLLGPPEHVALGTLRESQLVDHDIGAKCNQSHQSFFGQETQRLSGQRPMWRGRRERGAGGLVLPILVQNCITSWTRPDIGRTEYCAQHRILCLLQ